MLPLLLLPCALGWAPAGLASFEAKLSAEQWRIPHASRPMGLTGLQLHRTWDSGGYAGIGGWGAIRGEHGGFIAMGLSGGWRFRLSEHLRLDAGAWAGGGGLTRAGVGGGLLVRPHIELAWQEPWGTLGLGISRIDSPNGTLGSTQATLSASFPWSLTKGPPTGYLATDPGPGLGWRSFTLLATAQRYAPRGQAWDREGTLVQKSLDLAGLEIRMGIGGGAFFILDASGAARGQASGYMDTLAGLGCAWPLDGAGRWALVGKFEGGPAGGGRVDTGGGMAWKAMAGLETQFVHGYQGGFSLGYIAMPSGNFKGRVCQFQVGRRLDLASPGGRAFAPGDRFDWSEWGFSPGWQSFSSPQRKEAAPQAMGLVSLQIQHDLAGPCYAIGQASFALTGQAGGFGQGMLGLGLASQPIASRGPRFMAQCTAGAGGGGGVSTGGGFLVQPMIGLEQRLTPDWGLRIMGGRCIAPRGDLNTTVLELGTIWRVKVPTKQ